MSTVKNNIIRLRSFIQLKSSINFSNLFQMPYCQGVPEGSKPIREEEKQEILKRWEGQWDIQPLPRMAVKGPNAKFYVEYTTAHFDDENVIFSGGTSKETRTATSKGTVSAGLFDTANTRSTTKYTVDAPNEGVVTKLIFLRSPDGRYENVSYGLCNPFRHQTNINHLVPRYFV